MFTSLNHFLLILWIAPCIQASVKVPTVIYAYIGMPKVHLPCIATEKLGTTGTSQIESMWAAARQEADSYQMVIVKDKHGTKETFRQLNLGESIIQPNASLKNDRFYGRVNVSASFGLIISEVQFEDAGKFLCQYKDTETKVSDNSEVQLIVLNGTGIGTELKNDTTDSGNRSHSDNPNQNTSCMIWMALFGVCIGSLILVVLGGVAHIKYPDYFKCNWSLPQYGDGSDGIVHPSGDNFGKRNGEDTDNFPVGADNGSVAMEDRFPDLTSEL